MIRLTYFQVPSLQSILSVSFGPFRGPSLVPPALVPRPLLDAWRGPLSHHPLKAPPMLGPTNRWANMVDDSRWDWILRFRVLLHQFPLNLDHLCL